MDRLQSQHSAESAAIFYPRPGPCYILSSFSLTPTANISITMITIQQVLVCLVRTVDCGPNYIMVGEASDAMTKGLPSLLLTLDIGNYKYLMWELPSSQHSAQTHPLLTSPAQPFWRTTESLMEAASGVAATASVSCQTESEREFHSPGILLLQEKCKEINHLLSIKVEQACKWRTRFQTNKTLISRFQMKGHCQQIYRTRNSQSSGK